MEWDEALNQYSFAGVVAAGLVVAWLVGRRFGRWPRRAVLGVVVASAAGAVLLLQTGGGDISSTAEFDAVLAGPRPVVFEVYSDW